MFIKRSKGNVVWYESRLLNKARLTHAFFTRLGGYSPEPYHSLNFGLHVPDQPENVLANRELATNSIGLEYEKLAYLGQLGHSDKMLIDPEPGSYDGYDVIVASVKQPLGLSVADCAPVVLVHRNPDVAAIIHVGWRGLTERVVENAVSVLCQKFVLEPSSIFAAIGPTIRAVNYEIQDDVATIVENNLPEDRKEIIIHNGGYLGLDIIKGCSRQLNRQGVELVEVSELDTYSNEEEFYSFRREQNTGRQGIVVSL